MKKLMIVMTLAMMSAIVVAAPKTKAKKGSRAATGDVTSAIATTGDAALDEKVGKAIEKTQLERVTPLGTQALRDAPGELAKKSHKWGYFTMNYTTYVEWMDEIVVTWHIICDGMNQAKDSQYKFNTLAQGSADMKALPKLGRYTYYTLTKTFINIKKGDHKVTACLPADIIERYGQPDVLSVVIATPDGTMLAMNTQSIGDGVDIALPVICNNIKELSRLSTLKDPKKGKWWENFVGDDDLIDNKTGVPAIQSRWGLLDISETPFFNGSFGDYDQIKKVL
ncbi:MAG: hypothetical protein MJ109_01630 [Kiritimatiellae bacterium]|nr:hypothetical protein [Kiritimatiellia bacterium]